MQPWLTSTEVQVCRGVGGVYIYSSCLLKSIVPTEALLDMWASLGSLSVSIPGVFCLQWSSHHLAWGVGTFWIPSHDAQAQPYLISASKFETTFSTIAFPARWIQPH